jgi:hypothetical protein
MNHPSQDTMPEAADEQAMWHAQLILPAMKEIQGITLDFSIDSLRHFDQLLTGFHQQGIGIHQIPKIVFQIGCYLGQVVVNECPGSVWKHPEDISPSLNMADLVIQHPDGLIWSPMKTVVKKLEDPSNHSLLATALQAASMYGAAARSEATNQSIDSSEAPMGKTASRPMNTGFIEGTLVHTKAGMKPIEQIQVGDWVLSKPENGGEQAYKQVLKTFEYPSERVINVVYFENPEGGPMKIGSIFCTPNHPFCLEAQGWTAAVDIADSFDEENPRRKDRLFLVDESLVSANNVSHLYFTNDPNYAFSGDYDASDPGYLINLKTGLAEGNKVHHPIEEIRYGDHEDPFQKLPVFTLEVEDFHTYYVGKHGVWVHNQNCGGLNLNVEVRNTPNTQSSP